MDNLCEILKTMVASDPNNAMAALIVITVCFTVSASIVLCSLFKWAAIAIRGKKIVEEAEKEIE
jgi:hypothetical protein